METVPHPSRYRTSGPLMTSSERLGTTSQRGTTLVIAEKPSVARDIAEVLGATSRQKGYFEGGGYVVTWAIGHLVELAQPHEMNAAWKRWSFAELPMLPAEWPLVVSESTKDQYAVVKKLLRSREIKDVVCATDAGREGELIFRYVYEGAAAKKPVRRLWISSLTADAIRAGFRALRPGSDFDGLADAAKARSRADWLVGMNLSRAYSLVYDDHLSVGRVQTPTLAMIVARDLEIRDFVPVEYLEVVATFAPPQNAHDTNAPSASQETRYEGTYVREGAKGPEARRLPKEGELARAVMDRAKTGLATIASVDRDVRRIPPPLLYDLSEIQRDANRLFGMTAQRTLATLQSLYERYKLISYPRTDSRYLSTAIEDTLPAITALVAPAYPGLVAQGTGARPLGRRFVDDSKVSDHHAILPTETRAPASLPEGERALYDLVCRRLLAAYHDDHVLATTRVVTIIDTEGTKDRYESAGTSIEAVGWKVLERRAKRDEPKTLPAGLAKGLRRTVTDAKALLKKTEPPPHLSDATLLTAMETAGKTLDDKELSYAMRERGLGTAATRASILETLLVRGYVVRVGKALHATEKGIALVDRVHPHVKSPAMTGEWEARLGDIQRGELPFGTFMRDIEGYVSRVVEESRAGGGALSFGGSLPIAANGAPSGEVATSGSSWANGIGARREGASSAAPGEAIPASARPTPGARVRATATASTRATSATSAMSAARPATPATSRSVQPARTLANAATDDDDPRFAPAREAPRRSRIDDGDHTAPPSGTPARHAHPSDLDALLKGTFGLERFRPAQREVCEAVAEGRDVLLVMPTGAGKSLCYQLPGLARGGTTLVVSPLIALMEDQVEKLRALGLAAARIHSGRNRTESRAACVDYLAGKLDYLFIAPERLRVPGFPEMLAKRRPTLVAIDEAHCISQWGHDFRPDYRMLRERLPLLRPAPVVALTATATPDVQEDILKELDMNAPARFIRGFRRDNLAVEVKELGTSARAEAIVRILSDSARRPAIVYAPTRKEAEALATRLGKRGHALAYHAGMPASARDRAQSAFLNGKVDVIVATTAFGMGIDKANVRTVVHAALPATIEGYYQEIGRAGRDGLPSRAVMFHGYRDRKTHEFFLERDFPEPADLAKVARALRDEEEPLSDVRARVRMSTEDFERVVEKLWVFGGAIVRGEGIARATGEAAAKYLERYSKHVDHKRMQLDRMQTFADGLSCRMQALVRHFGDKNDAGERCGLCDSCAPESSIAEVARAATATETSLLKRVVAVLAKSDRRDPTVGQVHREISPDGDISRREVERVVAALVRAGVLVSEEDSMVKDGETIVFRRIALANANASASGGGAEGADGTAFDFSSVRLSGGEPDTPRGRRKRAPGKRARTKSAAGEKPARKRTRSVDLDDQDPLVTALRAYRSAEAKRLRVPAFRIFTDRVLAALTESKPTSTDELSAVAGVGSALVKKHGKAIVALIGAR